MKTLYIIRHAKSSWSFDLPDHDRPLGRRGRRDVLIVAKHLSENELTPDLMISSTASRALNTALYIADDWGYPEEQIRLDESLFHATSEHLLEVLSNIKEADSVAIVGHNPGFTDLVNHFAEDYVDNLPTCGIYALELNIDNWKDLKSADATKKFLLIPKRLPR